MAALLKTDADGLNESARNATTIDLTAKKDIGQSEHCAVLDDFMSHVMGF
jgi:hypothetical protein